MTNYSKWLLTLSAAFSLTLSGQAVQANSNQDLTKLASPLTLKQNNQQLQVHYQASQAQASRPIYHAVWSDENGKDDFKWYAASPGSTTIQLADHIGYGTYHVHTYIDIDGRLVGLNGTSINVKRPQVSTSITVPEAGLIDVRLENVPNTSSEILIPTWSESKGQDDIRWYKATANPDGSYSLRILLRDHNDDLGTYHLHTYERQKNSGRLKALKGDSLQIEPAHLPTKAEKTPNIHLDKVDSRQGSYQVRIEETLKSKSVKSVDIAVWSTSNQTNLYWYHPQKNAQGQFIADINLKNHQYLAGSYTTHAYINYSDGTRSGHALEMADLSGFQIPATTSSTYLGNGRFNLDFRNIYGSSKVKYAIWSDENGQDDIRWYDAKELAVGHFNGSLDLRHHRGSGIFHVHVYRWDSSPKLASTHSLKADEGMLPKAGPIRPNINHSGNLYPVGQCTWGVKGMASWVSNYWGNAKDWAANAKKQGFEVGSTPRTGAIAVWPQDGVLGGQTYGHVAYVTHVEADNRIQVMESNYAGKQYIGNFRGWFNPQKIWLHGRLVDSPVYYIYPKA